MQYVFPLLPRLRYFYDYSCVVWELRRRLGSQGRSFCSREIFGSRRIVIEDGGSRERAILKTTVGTHGHGRELMLRKPLLRERALETLKKELCRV